MWISPEGEIPVEISCGPGPCFRISSAISSAQCLSLAVGQIGLSFGCQDTAIIPDRRRDHERPVHSVQAEDALDQGLPGPDPDRRRLEDDLREALDLQVRVAHLAVAQTIAGLERDRLHPEDGRASPRQILRVERDLPLEPSRRAFDRLAGAADREGQAARLRVEGKRDLAGGRGRRYAAQDQKRRDPGPRPLHRPPPGTKRRRSPIAAAYSGRARSARSSVRTRARRSARNRTAAAEPVIQAPPASGSAVTSTRTAT